MTSRRSRTERAIAFRDYILPLVRAHGQWETASSKNGPIKSLAWRDGPWHASYRTPFQSLHHSDPAFLRQIGKLNLPYGLDVWWKGGGKVLNIEWDDEKVLVVSYKRGPWEEFT